MSREYLYNEELEEDGILVDELLNGLNEWRAVPDIVRLTFKALSDVVKTHTTSLRELEIQIATKANRSELVQKANISDLNRAFSDVRSGPESKSLETFQSLLEEKVSRKECQYIISGKFNEIKSEIDKKADSRELQSEIRSLRSQIEELNFKKKQSKELDEVYRILEEKVNISDLNAALEEKANKQSIASALHKKVNRNDIEAMLLTKADLSELQSILAILETKADRHTIELLSRENTQKFEKNDILKYVRDEMQKRSEFEAQDSVNRIKREIDLRISIEQTQITLSEEIANKIAGGDPEIRTEITRITSSFRNEIKKTEDKYNDKILRIDNGLKGIYEEFNDVKANLGVMLKKLDEKEKNSKFSESGYENMRQEVRININKEIDKVFREISTNKKSFDDQLEYRMKELQDLIESKPSKFEIANIISESKFNRVFIEETEQIKKSLEILGKRNLSEIYDVLDAIRNDMQQKVSNQDLFIFLKNKPDIDEVKDLISTLTRSSDEKAIIETLCSENCTGR